MWKGQEENQPHWTSNELNQKTGNKISLWEQEQEGVLDMQMWHQDYYDNNLQ